MLYPNRRFDQCGRRARESQQKLGIHRLLNSVLKKLSNEERFSRHSCPSHRNGAKKKAEGRGGKIKTTRRSLAKWVKIRKLKVPEGHSKFK
jgi:hypothetical protein